MTIQAHSASVEARALTKRYGAVTAVDAVSFVIEAGNLVTLLGPSGCGKTTTLRMIAGLEVASGGTILIGGEDVTLLPPSERDVSMVFQSYALFPHMTVMENVSYGLAGLPKAEQREKAQEGLRLVGLEGYEERLPSELSGGQQQRVACARALVLEPRVLLFDEPLSNLDAKLRRRMRDDIRDLQQKLGLTSVYVTHDQEEALAVSDRIIVMDRGRIAQEGTPTELYEQPADAFVADFIGGANLCRVRGDRPRRRQCDCKTRAPDYSDQQPHAYGWSNARHPPLRGTADESGRAPLASRGNSQGHLSRVSLGLPLADADRRAVCDTAGCIALRSRDDCASYVT